MANLLDSVHLGEKQAMCRMRGEDEAKGLRPSETLGDPKRVFTDAITARASTENTVKDQKPKKKGRLVKEDLTLGQEYFTKLAAKDDFPESENTETDDTDTTDSESSAESDTTSYRESDFTQAQNRQKTTGRRRTNSYRRLASKTERNKQSEGPLYADDEGSETPGATRSMYPKLEWTTVEKIAKQADFKSQANEEQNALNNDGTYYAQTRNSRLAANQHHEDAGNESYESSISGSISDSNEEAEEASAHGYSFPHQNPEAQYQNYPPFPYANFHSISNPVHPQFSFPSVDSHSHPTSTNLPRRRQWRWDRAIL
jgi:hypothetical protein